MKRKFPYLGSGDKRDVFNRLIEVREVKEGLGDVIIGRFKKCMDGNKYIELNRYYENGNYKEEKCGYISLEDKNIVYLALLLILCDGIEGIIGFGSNINVILGCGINGEMMKIISESFVFLKNLRILDLSCKIDEVDKIGNHKLGDKGCSAIFNNAKYLTNLLELYLYGNKYNNGIDCGITDKSTDTIINSSQYLRKLSYFYLSGILQNNE